MAAHEAKGVEDVKKRVEGWLIVYADGGSHFSGVPVVPFKDNPGCAIAYTVVHLVECDPAAEAVVMAALKPQPHVTKELARAVEHYEKRRKGKQ